MIHNLKIKRKYFLDVENGKKNFELREIDRDYQVGDILMLKSIDEDGKHTGDYISKEICYILKDAEEHGLDKDYCILGLKDGEEEIEEHKIKTIEKCSPEQLIEKINNWREVMSAFEYCNENIPAGVVGELLDDIKNMLEEL